MNIDEKDQNTETLQTSPEAPQAASEMSPENTEKVNTAEAAKKPRSRKNTKAGRSSSLLFALVFVLLLGVVGFSGYKVVSQLLVYKEGNDVYNDLMKQFVSEGTQGAATDTTGSGEDMTEPFSQNETKPAESGADASESGTAGTQNDPAVGPEPSSAEQGNEPGTQSGGHGSDPGTNPGQDPGGSGNTVPVRIRDRTPAEAAIRILRQFRRNPSR